MCIRDSRYYQEMRNIWQVMHPAFTPSEINVFEAEKKVLANIATTRRNIARTLIIYWQRMAAVLVIPLLIICTYLFLEKDNGVYDAIEYQEVKSPHGTFSEVRLPCLLYTSSHKESNNSFHSDTISATDSIERSNIFSGSLWQFATTWPELFSR